jgi:hypothetical protein
LLDAGRPQPGETVAINRALPGEKFLDRQHIAAAGFFEREEPAANGCNHFGLATNHPARRPWRREIGNCQRATVGPDNMLPWAVTFGHFVLALCEQPNSTPSNLKISLTKTDKSDALGAGRISGAASAMALSGTIGYWRRPLDRSSRDARPASHMLAWQEAPR